MRGTTSLLLPVQFLGVEVLITFYLLLLPPAILHCALSHGQRSPDAGVVSCGDHSDSDAHCDAEVNVPRAVKKRQRLAQQIQPARPFLRLAPETQPCRLGPVLRPGHAWAGSPFMCRFPLQAQRQFACWLLLDPGCSAMKPATLCWPSVKTSPDRAHWKSPGRPMGLFAQLYGIVRRPLDLFWFSF
jgi:hypothetical protein